MPAALHSAAWRAAHAADGAVRPVHCIADGAARTTRDTPA